MLTPSSCKSRTSQGVAKVSFSAGKIGKCRGTCAPPTDVNGCRTRTNLVTYIQAHLNPERNVVSTIQPTKSYRSNLHCRIHNHIIIRNKILFLLGLVTGYETGIFNKHYKNMHICLRISPFFWSGSRVPKYIFFIIVLANQLQ